MPVCPSCFYQGEDLTDSDHFAETCVVARVLEGVLVRGGTVDSAKVDMLPVDAIWLTIFARGLYAVPGANVIDLVERAVAPDA